MLRSIRSTAFLGTLLLAGAALAQPAAPPAGDDSSTEGKKPGSPEAPVAPATAPQLTAGPTAAASEAAPEPEAAKAKKPRTVEGAGLSTQGAIMSGIGAASEAPVATDDWGFKFRGFFRGPMRLGIDNSGSLRNEVQFHAPPVVPDGNYTRWSFTNVSPGPWAELLFQYGTQQVMMTTSIASYNITSGGWRELQDQLGIDRAFLTLKFPEALGSVGGLSWDVGVFTNRYGAMGKYDAGAYETYLMGRTRIAGETLTADIELNDDFKLVIEHGIGAKMDQQYQTYLASGSPTYIYPTWMPYPGYVQQGTTLLHHAHVGIVYNGVLTATLHYLDAFSRDARVSVDNNVGNKSLTAGPGSAGVINTSLLTPDAHIQVIGFDLRLDGGWMGDGYLGYSNINAKNSSVISDAIEVLHSQGGWQMTQNYFSKINQQASATNDGTGTIHTIGFQYNFSLAAFMMRPRPFWGQTADINVKIFGMYNKITNSDNGSDMSKLKYGTDIIYSPLPMLAGGLRIDAVNPDMSNSKESFYVFSPKLIFRTQFVTHEMVVLQYSYYHYGSGYSDNTTLANIMPFPYGQYGTLATSNNYRPDKHTITLAASMWW